MRTVGPATALLLLAACGGSGSPAGDGAAPGDADGVATGDADDPRAPLVLAPELRARLHADLDARDLALLARLSPLGPVPPDPTNRVADDPAAARLGQALFFDAGLSRDGTVSCATCHDPDHGFSDPAPLAQGLGPGERHAPTLLNAAYQRWFGWGGRADSLWMQALGPLTSEIEMGGTAASIAEHVLGDPERRAAFEAVFGPVPELPPSGAHDDESHDDESHGGEAPDGEARARRDEQVLVNVAKALAAYERRLVRGDAPFDRFVAALRAGDVEGLAALDPSQQRGLDLFLGRAGCSDCHLGPNLTDDEFHNTAAPPHPDGRADDGGRYAGVERLLASPYTAAGPHSDDPEGPAARRVRHLVRSSEQFGAFKTPSLRNLADRAPYMHQGQFPDLAAVVHFYDTREGVFLQSHHQEQILAPLRLTEVERADLLAFLTGLEGAPLDPALTVRPAAPR